VPRSSSGTAAVRHSSSSELCHWCEEEFDPGTSDAHDRRVYCSRDCELKDGAVDD
jgi:hypothetical protein